MTESKLALDRYKKAKDEAEHSIAILSKNKEKIKDETEYALIHLKEYINYYRLRVNEHDTLARRKIIREKIISLFPNADPNRINSYLRKKLVLNYLEYALFFIPILIFTTYYLMSRVFEADTVDLITSSTFFPFIAFGILSIILAESRLIRLYPLYKIKESKDES